MKETKISGVNMKSKKLFQEIAIDPSSLILDEVLNALKYEINVFNSRLISQVTNSWFNQVSSNIKNINDVNLRKKIEQICLSVKFQNNFFKNPYRRQVFNRNDWLNAVVESNKNLKFDAIVTQDKLAFDNIFNDKSFEEFLETSKVITGSINVGDFESLDDFFKQIEPFLIINRRIVIINDSQLLLSHRATKHLFQKTFNFWASNGGVSMTIIRSQNANSFKIDNWLEEINELKNFLLNTGFKGKFRFLAVDDLKKITHRRAILGNICGISAEYGLEYHSNFKKQMWDVMSKSTHDSFYRDFFEKEIVLSFPFYKYIKFDNGVFETGEKSNFKL